MMAITPLQIAGAMRLMGWRIAPRLMDRWSSLGAWTMTSAIKSGSTSPSAVAATHIDSSTVTMSWVKGFGGPSAAFTDLAANALNTAGQTQLRARLAAAGWSRGTFTHGSRTLTAVQLDSAYAINFRGFGGMSDTINDLYGALGSAALKAAVVGRVEVRGSAQVFVVGGLGIYLRDTYDFIDTGWVSQPLGIWNTRRCLSKLETAAYASSPAATIGYTVAGFEPVNNATFNAWRSATGRGGDFLVYSDVEWVSSPVSEIPL